MKFNKWTLGLAAVGAVSLTSVAQAEEKMMLGSQAAAGLTSTTISGYVDTSAHWNIGNDNVGAPTGAAKQDGFNLNVIQVSLSKALDESEWASGYRADLWFGPDANGLGSSPNTSTDTVHPGSTTTTTSLAIRQAYVALRTPVGNGIDWKLGVFDTIVGYETLESGNNPNYTRSYGFSMEPTTHTGLLGTYRFCDSVSASAGIANSFGPVINARASDASGGESHKAYMGSVALTAPSDWGWVAGSSLYLGAISGFDSGTASATGNRQHYYAGLTLATPVAGMKVGAALDYSHAQSTVTLDPDNQYAYGLYASFQATEKLSLHGRAELLHTQGAGNGPGENVNADVYAWTLTAQYDLWKNVISRVELRWDHHESDNYQVNGNGSATQLDKNTYLAALNIIYKF